MAAFLGIEEDLWIFGATLTLLAVYLLYMLIADQCAAVATAKRDIIACHLFIYRTHVREIESYRYSPFWFTERPPINLKQFLE